MIYIIGDRHGEPDGFSEAQLPGQSAWTAKDIVIVTGDFGYVMRGEAHNAAEKRKLDELAEKPYKILFCDGNHENFDALSEYPEEIRFGGPIRKIRKNIFWLQRGYIYGIDGKSFFVMGGAYSIDKAFRLYYAEMYGEKIWFPQELPCKEEYARAIAELRSHNMCVDYIITHTAPTALIPRLIGKAPDPHDAELTGFFEWVYTEVQFQKWFFGHFHMDLQLNERIRSCYKEVIPLTDI